MLLRLIGIRLLVIASVVVPHLLYKPEEMGNPIALFLISTGCVQALFYLALLHSLKRWPVRQVYIQLLGDIALVTGLILKTGADSLSPLYIVIITVASLFLSRNGVLVIACFAFLFYLVVAFRWGGPLAGWPEIPSETTGILTLLYKLISHLVGFYGVAIMTSYMSRATERVQARLEKTHLDLSYLQGLYGDVIDSMTSGLAITDLGGRLVSLNASGEQILGRSSADLQGHHIAGLGIFSREAWEEQLEETGKIPVRAEIKCQRSDGELIDLGYTLSQLRDREGTWHGYILIFQDLTEWHELQEQVRTQDRMAALGQMAAGLAHEVGNPLAAISGSVEMLSKNLHGKAAPQHKLLDILLRESHRLDRTVKAFLQFAKPREGQLSEFDIASVLLEDIELLRNSGEVLPSHEIIADVVPDSAVVHADRDQVDQIFWNLTRNGLQAMPEGGQLGIKGRLEGEVYRLEVSDTGRGMTEDEKARLFQPFKSFFDGGVGLGMAIVYRIIEEHGGSIQVNSEPGKGSRILIELPIHPPSIREGEVA